jgi:hypothetical protein
VVNANHVEIHMQFHACNLSLGKTNSFLILKDQGIKHELARFYDEVKDEI